jgi:hypothetical protein
MMSLNANPASAGKPTHLRRMDPDWLPNGEQLTIMPIFFEAQRDGHFVTMVGAIAELKNIVGSWPSPKAALTTARPFQANLIFI